jgi:hypothetical protein
VEQLSYSRACVRIGDDDEPLSLREAAGRRAPHRPDDSFECLSRDRLGVVVTNHPALF